MLANSHHSQDCQQTYARGTLVRTTLETTQSTVLYIAEPSGDTSTLIIPNENLLNSKLFANGEHRRVIYVNHSGTNGRKFNFWPYKNAWKLKK